MNNPTQIAMPETIDQYFAENPVDYEAMMMYFLTQNYLEDAYNFACSKAPHLNIPPIKEEDEQRIVNCALWNSSILIALYKFKAEMPDQYQKAVDLLYLEDETSTETDDFSLRELMFMEGWFYYTQGIDQPSAN